MSSPQNLSKGKFTCGMRYIGRRSVGDILCLPHIFPYEPTSPHVPQGKFGVPDLSRTSHLILRRNPLFLMSYWDMLKLVAVLWVSTPLSLQRAASKPIDVGEPVLRTGQDQIPEYQAIEITGCTGVEPVSLDRQSKILPMNEHPILKSKTPNLVSHSPPTVL